MGLFGKKEKEVSVPELPRLPELPKLPSYPQDSTQLSDIPTKEFPTIDDLPRPKDIHELPRFPTNQLGTQFSQNTIKKCCRGRR